MTFALSDSLKQKIYGKLSSMLHLVISTPRSGSNSLCRYIQQVTGAKNLYEVITDARDEHNNLVSDPAAVIKQLLQQSQNLDLVVKCHVDHLMMLYPQRMDVLHQLLTSAKLYYCLRLNLLEQIKSTIGIEFTGVCDHRTATTNILIRGQDALRIYSKILLETSIQGELYKYYPGDIMILEHMSSKYAEADLASNKYNDIYCFTYDSEYTKTLVEQKINVKSVFEQGNSLYRFIGA